MLLLLLLLLLLVIVLFVSNLDVNRTICSCRPVRSCLIESFFAMQLMALGDVERLGLETPSKPKKPLPSDVALVTFSSGSTGYPKAIALSHRNVLAALGACWHGFWRNEQHGDEDVHVAYLPYGFVFERLIQVILFGDGVMRCDHL
jgi:long-subunit acyl-CoA synthetase (AMP-forming)